MKIICVGWNYPDHNLEMKHETVSEPVIFMKPDSALLRENKPFLTKIRLYALIYKLKLKHI